MKGHRPVAGTWDGKNLRYVFAAADPAAAAHADTPGGPKGATRTTGKGKTRRTQEGFAAHLRHVARMDPAGRHQRVAIRIDNAPWPGGERIDEAPGGNPHLGCERLPRDSRQRDPIERFGKPRRRTTHNRRFDSLADLKSAIRNSRRDLPTARNRVRTLRNRQSRKPSPPGS